MDELEPIEPEEALDLYIDSYFSVGESSGLEIELAGGLEGAGAFIELTEPQREDLSHFMGAGNPDRIRYDTTELVFPDGTTKVVGTYAFHEQPERCLETSPSW